MALPYRFEVLAKEKYEAFHEATLKILKETGFKFMHDDVLALFKKHGAKVDGNIVYFSRDLVEKHLKTVPRSFRWKARNDDHSVTCGEGFLVQPIAGAVNMHDLDHGVRPGTLEDIGNIQKIYQSDDVYDLVGMIACEPSDTSQEDKHLHIMYQILKHTDKPVNGFMTYGRHAKAQVDMMEIAMGGRQVMDENHCIAVSTSATTPLTYTHEALETMLEFVRRNQVPTIISLPSAGTTAPLSLLGTAVLQNAEIIGGIVLTQLIKPGNPTVYCPSAAASNMKTGDYTLGAPEGMLINVANLQMALDYYHFPTRAMPGCTDSKRVDYQAGVETMQNLMVGMLAGAHILNESVGVLDNILTCSYEKTILDAESVRRVKRICQGVDGPDGDMSVDLIQAIGHSGNTHLTHPKTYEHCRKRWQPSISFWGTYENWLDEGAEDVVMRANRKYKEILKAAPDSLIDSELDRDLKAYIKSHVSS